MARIEGSVIRSDGSGTSFRDAHIEWNIVEHSVTNKTTTINVKSYYDILGGVTGYTIAGTSLLKYDGGNEHSNTVSFIEGSAGISHLMSEKNYIIEHSNNGKERTVALYAYSTLMPNGLYTYMEISGNIVLPKISNGNIKISSLWKQAFCWRNTLGTWKRCLIWRKINGTWKKGV